MIFQKSQPPYKKGIHSMPILSFIKEWRSENCDRFQVNTNYPRQKIDCKNMISGLTRHCFNMQMYVISYG